MNLLYSAWIPVRADNGVGPFRLLSYEELLCGEEHWAISLPRDDLELACIQLLMCITQIVFLPTDDAALRAFITKPLNPEQFADRIAPFGEWFDLDHPTQPFMQTRGVEAKEDTPIQKLLIGLPEGNNHAFFNEVGEVKRLGPTVAAIALFNQAMNCPGFGRDFKCGLRGSAPVTTLVAGRDLRETVWRNVLTLPRVRERFPNYQPGAADDVPTWIRPIRDKEIIHVSLDIKLARGLFWQPAHVELIKAAVEASCDVLGGAAGAVYSGFRKERFSFTVEGIWPHPHGIQIESLKKGVIEKKFVSFTTTAPAWTLLSEFIVPRDLNNKDIKEGCVPAGPVIQAGELLIRRREKLHLIVGGYRNKQASVLERRHELISLASSWQDNQGQIVRLVNLGKIAKKILRGQLWFAAQGDKERGMKGIGVSIHEPGEKIYYARTENLFYELLDKEDDRVEEQLARELSAICKAIFEELTNPYTHKPELIPIIARTRRKLARDLKEMREKT